LYINFVLKTNIIFVFVSVYGGQSISVFVIVTVTEISLFDTGCHGFGVAISWCLRKFKNAGIRDPLGSGRS